MVLTCHLTDRYVLTQRNGSCMYVSSAVSKHAWRTRVALRAARAAPRVPASGITSSSSRPGSPERHAKLSAVTDSNSTSSSDGDEDSEFAQNMWQPVPPTPAIGRKRKVALLLGCAMLEVAATGGLMWAPLLGAIALAMLQPTRSEIAHQQDEAVKQAVAAARIRMLRELPVTPVESGAWLNRLLQEMWVPFCQPFLLANNLNMWQDTMTAAAPRGWAVEIADVSIGSIAPELTDFQAYADPNSGTVTAIDCKMDFNSSDVRFVVVGRGPLGAFTARVSAVKMTGQVRITPVLQHRMMLVAFKDQPTVRVSLSISAPLFKTSLSPGDLGQLDFIQGLLGAAIKDMLVEPRRMAVILDSDIRVEEAVATTLHLTIDSLTGLTAALGHSSSSSSSAAAGDRGRESAAAGRKSGGQSPRIVITAIDTLTQSSRSTTPIICDPSHTSATIREDLSLELPRKQGIFRLEARDISHGSGRSSVLGSCLLWVEAARDGTTLFWSHERSGAPIASRWAPSDPPWRINLPMFSTPAAAGDRDLRVHLGVSVEPWVYKSRVTGVAGTRSDEPRVVVLQVVEARGLSLPGSSSSSTHDVVPSTHIQVCYDQECFSTATYYNSSSPVYNELFAFQENPGIMTRRMKLEVWHEGPAGSSSSSNPGSGSGSGGSVSGKGLGKRGASGFSNGTNKAFKSLGFGRSGGKGFQGHRSTGSSSSSSSSKVVSHHLSDLPEEEDVLQESNNNNDVPSHMLFDVEVEDSQSVESEGLAQQQQQLKSGTYDGSSSTSTNGSSVSLGSAVINLDQLAEDVIQDRWLSLNGVDGGEVRVRMTVAHGPLPHRDREPTHGGSSSSGGTISSSSADVAELLSFFHRSLQGSSRDSLLVEVVSARLYLPLSSMDSSDVDQPAYLLQYNGNSTITLPPHLQHPYWQQQQRSKSPKLIGGSSSRSRSSSRASSSRGSGKTRAASPMNSHLFDDVTQGNVSAQVNAQYCIARAVFPLAAAAAADQAAGNSSSSSSRSVLGPTDSAGSIAAAAVATAADALPGSNLSDPAAAAAAAAAKLSIVLLDPDDLSGNLSAAAAASSSSHGSSRNMLYDMGSAEVDVIKLLQESGVSLSKDDSSSSTSVSTAAAANWEGWIRLNKDGGHLLLRVTQLPASEAADLAPPPSAATLANTAASSNGSSNSKTPVSAAAAAAAVNGNKSGSSSSSDGRVGDDGDGIFGLSRFVPSLPADVKHVIKKGFAEAPAQVSGVVGQLSDSASNLWSSSSSTVGGWMSSLPTLPTWANIGSSSSSSDKGKGSSTSDRGEGSSSSDKGEGSSSSSSSSSDKGKGSSTQKQKQAADRSVSADHRSNGKQQQLQIKRELERQQQQHPEPLSSVDLKAIARSWGWNIDEVKKVEQQQQQQAGKQDEKHARLDDRHSSSSSSSNGNESGMSGIVSAISNMLRIGPRSSNSDKQQQQQRKLTAGADRQQEHAKQQTQQQQQQRQAPVQRLTILLDPSEQESGIMHSIDGGHGSSSRGSSPAGSQDGRDEVLTPAAGPTSGPQDQSVSHRSPANTDGSSSSSSKPEPQSVSTSSNSSSKGSSSGGTQTLQQQQQQQEADIKSPVQRNAGAAAVGEAESTAATLGSNPLAIPIAAAAASALGSRDNTAADRDDDRNDDQTAAAARSDPAAATAGGKSPPAAAAAGGGAPAIPGDGSRSAATTAAAAATDSNTPGSSAAGGVKSPEWSYDGDGDEEQCVVDSSGCEAAHQQEEF